MPTNVFKLGDWIYIVPLGLAGFLLGIYGFTACGDCSAVASGQPTNHVGVVQAATHTLGLIKASGNFPLDRDHWALFLAQIIMPALAFVGVVKLVLQNVRRDARLLWARRLRNHTIVCGLGDTGAQIVESFRDAGRQVVVIALNADTPYAANCERRHVAVLEGDAARPSMLKLAGLKHAHSLVVACGSDGANLEIGMRARDLLKGLASHPVKILPELRSEWLYDLVKTQGAGALGSADAEFQLFNLNSNAARLLLQSESFLRGVPDAAPQPHLLFAGFGQMGAEILVRAVRSNFAMPGQKVAATILDERGPASIAAAQTRCAGIQELADISLVACEFLTDDASWQDGLIEGLKARPPLAVIVALKADDIALSVAMRLRKLLDGLGLFVVPVFVRIRQQQRLGDFLAGMESPSLLGDRLRPFGGLSYLTSPAILLDQSLDVLARAAHEIWLRNNAGSGSPAAVPWDKLSEFHKQSNRALADYILIRLRCCGLRLAAGKGPKITLDDAAVEKLAALEHWRWCIEMRSMGWRQSAVRDDFLKLHNRLVDWTELPDSVKTYNREMARLLPDIVDAAAMSVRRDRLVFADAGLESAPEAEPGSQAVIVVDPWNEKAWASARQAARDKGAILWALLRDGAAGQIFARAQEDNCSVEIWLGEREFAALQSARVA